MSLSNLIYGFLLLIFCQQILGDDNVTSKEVTEIPVTDKNAKNVLINYPLPAQYILASPFNNAANINKIIRTVRNNPFSNIILPYCTPIPRRITPGIPIPLNIVGHPTIMCNENIPLIQIPTGHNDQSIRRINDTNLENIDQENKSEDTNNNIVKASKISNFSNRNKDLIININEEVPSKHENSVISSDIHSNPSVKDNASSNGELSTNKIISEHFKFDSILLNKDRTEDHCTAKNETEIQKSENESNDTHVHKHTIDEENPRLDSKGKMVDTGPALANFVGDKITLNFFGKENQSRHEDDCNEDHEKHHELIPKPKVIHSELMTDKDNEVSSKHKEVNDEHDKDVFKIPPELISSRHFWDKGTLKPFYEIYIPEYDVLRNWQHPYSNQKTVSTPVEKEYCNALRNNLAQREVAENWSKALKQYQNQQSNVYFDNSKNFSPLFGVKKNMNSYIVATDPRNSRNGLLNKYSDENGIYFNKRTSPNDPIFIQQTSATNQDH